MSNYYNDFARRYRALYPGASDAEIQAGYDSTKSGVLGSLGEGVQAGLGQTLGGFGTIGAMLGLDTQDYANRMYQYAAEHSLPADLQGRLWDNPGYLLNPEWLAYNTGQVLPSLASTLIPGGLAARGARAIPALAPYANWIGGGVAALTGSSQEAAGYYREHPDDPWGAALYGALDIPLNAIAPATLLGRGGIGGRLLKSSLWEAGTEWAEEPLQAAIAGEPIIEAMKSGLNVVPGTFLSSLMLGAPAAFVGGNATARQQARMDPNQMADAIMRELAAEQTPQQVETWAQRYNTNSGEIDLSGDVEQAIYNARQLPETVNINTPERVQLRAALEDQLYGNGAPRQERIAEVVLGTPGAGKSTLTTPMRDALGALEIDTDIVKRLLPGYNGGVGAAAVHRESQGIGANVLARAVSRGDNIIVPLVGREYDRVSSIIKSLKEQGYTVNVKLMDLAPKTAAERAINRFRNTGRLVDPLFIMDEVGNKPRLTYEQLKKDGIADDYQAFDNEVPQGQRPKILEQITPSDGRGLGQLGSVRGGPEAATQAAEVGHKYTKEEVPFDRLRKDLNRKPGVGAAKNPRTVLHDENGIFVVGPKTTDDWVTMVEQVMTPKEIDAAANWYSDLVREFETTFGKEEGQNILNAFLLANQNAKPSDALYNAMRAEEKLKGLKIDKKAGLNEKAVMAALQGKPIESGAGQKILDFIDSTLGRETRTVMNDDARGGKPFVIDVHTGRDMGFVDEIVRGYVAKRFGAQAAANLQLDYKPVTKGPITVASFKPTETQYEWGRHEGNLLTQELADRGWHGGKLTSAQVQAIGWVAIQKYIKGEAETAQIALKKNNWTIAFEAMTDRYPALNNLNLQERIAFTKKATEIALEAVDKFFPNHRINVFMGLGGWQGSVNPNVQTSEIITDQGAKVIGNMLGLLLKQDGVYLSRMKPNGNTLAVDIHTADPRLADPVFLSRFWNRIHELDPKVGDGFSPVSMPNGEQGIRIFRDSKGKQELNYVNNQLSKLVERVADEMGIEEMGLSPIRVQTDLVENNWEENPNGENYRESLSRLLGPEVSGRLVSDYGSRIEQAIAEATGQQTYESRQPAPPIQRLIDKSKKFFGTTDNPAEAGYVMPDGTMLDFSGRHYASGYENVNGRFVAKRGQPDYLAGDRAVDHREIAEVVGKGGSEGMIQFMNEAHALRFQPNVGFDTSVVPTMQQLATVIKNWNKTNPGEALTVDVSGLNGESLGSKEFVRPTVDEIQSYVSGRLSTFAATYKQQTPYEDAEVAKDVADQLAYWQKAKLIPGESRIKVTPIEDITLDDMQALAPQFELIKEGVEFMNSAMESDGISIDQADFEQRKVITGIINDLIDSGLPPHLLAGDFFFGTLKQADETGGRTNAMFTIDPTGASWLVVNEKMIDALIESGDSDLATVARIVVAHELGHALGIRTAGPGHALQSKALHYDPTGIALFPAKNRHGAKIHHARGTLGPVINEVLKVFESNAGHNAGLDDWFIYPMMDENFGIQRLNNQALVMENGKIMRLNDASMGTQFSVYKQMVDVAAHFTAEVFAQLHALYYYKPDVMAKMMPVSYRYMRHVTDEFIAARNERSIRGVREAIQSRPPASVPVQLEAFASRSGTGGFENGPASRGMGEELQGPAGAAGQGVPYSQPAGGPNPAAGAQPTGAAGTGAPARLPGQQRQPAGAEPLVTRQARHMLPSQVTEQARRGTQTWDVTEKLAELLGTDPNALDDFLRRKYGESYNSEELQNAANLVEGEVDKAKGTLQELVEKIDTTGLNDADLAKAYEMMVNLTGLSAQFMGVRAEAGRALQIFRKLQEQVGMVTAMQHILEKQGGRKVMEQKIKKLARLAENPGAIMEGARKGMEITRWDQFNEWYTNVLLTGIPTHVVNNVSNALMQAFYTLDRWVAAGIGEFHGGERVTAQEAYEYTKGMMAGIQQGVAAAARAWNGEDQMGLLKSELPYKEAIPGKAGKVIRIPTRLLGAEDAFFKGMTVVRELSALAARKGLDVQKVLANPPKDLLEQAWNHADVLTFTQPAGEVAQALTRLKRKVPAMHIITPFIRTPSNIVKEALTRSPLAPLFSDWRAEVGKGGAARDIALARVAVGSSLALATVGLAMAGLLVGQPPDDPNERRLWYAQGKQPNSIKIGDTWVSFSRLEPFGMLLGMTADMVQLAHRMGDVEAGSLANLIIGSMSSNLMSKTYLRGLSDLIQAMNDPERHGERWIRNFAASATVPVLFSYMARAHDPYLRQAETMLDAIKARVPLLRETLPVKLDVFGQPISAGEGGGAYKMVSPAYLKKEQHDPVVNELLKYDVSFPAQSKRIRGVELSGDQYNDLAATIGKPTYAALQRVIQSQVYQGLPDPLRKWMLDRVVSSMRNNARTYWLIQHPEIMKEAMQKKREAFYAAGQ